MASYANMSLEDIIKKKKKETRLQGSTTGSKGNQLKKGIPMKRVPITDARNKIISKKRTQITDARDKLAELAKQNDARLKLDLLRKRRTTINQMQGKEFNQGRGKFVRNLSTNNNRDRVFLDPTRQVVSQPLTHTRSLSARKPINNNTKISTKRFLENRIIGNRSLDAPPKVKPIIRTVENDIQIIDDPMDGEYVPSRSSKSSSAFNRKGNLQLRIIARNNDNRESRNAAHHRLSTPEKDKSPPRPPSILKKRPMAAMRSDKKIERNEKPALEFRIIVSNLRSSVTGGDIEELFGDVGGMVESRLVRPGTAEVIYKSLEDAQKAVDLYHNRQLDGQPMNCLLVTPRSTASAPSRNGSKPAFVSSNSNVEPDISTFHKVLFSNF